MKPSADLHQLIHALSGNEKRYFKLFAEARTGKHDPSYLKLFEAIEGQDVYDEKALKQQFAKTQSLQHFSRTKHYLYELILKSMRVYHTGKTADRRLRALLSDIAFHYEKGLLKKCQKLVHKAKQLAHRYEKWTTLLDIFEWEKQIMHVADDLPALKRYLDAGGEEETGAVRQIHTCLSYQRIKNEIILRFRNAELVRSPEERQFFEELIHDPLLKEAPIGHSFRIMADYHLIFSMYYLTQNDFNKRVKHLKAAIALYEAYPHFIREAPLRYISPIYKLAGSYLRTGNTEQMHVWMKKLKSISREPYCKTNEIVSVHLFSNIYALELGYYFMTAQFEQGMQLLPEVEAWLKKNEGKVEKKLKIVFLMNITTVYFIMGGYANALEWLNKVSQESKYELRADIQSFARLLSLIIHYELGHFDLLEYHLRSVYRYLLQKKQLYQFEKTILQFIKKELLEFNPNDKQAMKSVFRKLKERLQQLSVSPYEEKILNNSYLVPWLESKIRDRPLVDIIQENPPVRGE